MLAESVVSFQNPAGDSGYGTPGELRPKADVVSTTTFSKVVEGGAAVNVGSMSSIADDKRAAGAGRCGGCRSAGVGRADARRVSFIQHRDRSVDHFHCPL